MAMVGIPSRMPPQSSDYSVIHGLRAAVEAISEPTEQQKEHLQLQTKLNSKNFVNKGRVICITSARDDASMKSLEDIFHTIIQQNNALSVHKADLLPIDYCHLVIINLYPSNMESKVNDRGQQEVIMSTLAKVLVFFSVETNRFRFPRYYQRKSIRLRRPTFPINLRISSYHTMISLARP